MSVAEADIERIVRQVLRQLDVGVQASVGVQATACVKESSSLKADLQQADLKIVEPVVTQARLAGQLNGVQSVSVSRTAVVTPAARDLLKQHGIQLVRVDVAKSRAAGEVVLAAAETDYDAAGLVRMLNQQAVKAERLAQCGLLTAIDELVDQVARGGRIGMLLTRQTAAALCLTNRASGVRAVLATNVETVRTARTSFAANLLIADPRGRSAHDLASTIRACASLAPQWSAGLRDRLT